MSFIGSPTAINNDPQFRSRPVGAGPFIMKQWIQQTSITLTRNPNYWNAPRPYLDQVVFKIITDEQQGVNSYKAGEMQFEQTLIASSADQVLKAGGVPHNVVINGGPNLYFNTSKPPFNDVRARQAFIMGIDRADYDKVVQSGLIDPIDSIFRPGSPFYDPSLVQLSYDPVKAQTLFSQVAADTGGPVTFDISSYNSGGYDIIGQYFQGALSKYKDVKVTLSLASVLAHTQDLNAGNFQAGVAGNPFVDPEPTMTTKYTCDASPPVTRWCNSQYDALVKDQRLTLDANQRIADFKQIQKILYQEAPAYYFDRRVIFYIGTPAVQDVDWINDGSLLLDRMWLKR
jgi:peptide/nickel transport system substrate-binding protein